MAEGCIIRLKNFLDTNEQGVEIANGAIDMLLRDYQGGENTTCQPDCGAKKLFPIFADLGMIELVSNDEEANIQVYKTLSAEGLQQMKHRIATEYVKEG